MSHAESICPYHKYTYEFVASLSPALYLASVEHYESTFKQLVVTLML